MNLLEIWVHTPAAAALGWTLAHSLWEGALVALLLVAALGVLRIVARAVRRRLRRDGRSACRPVCSRSCIILRGAGNSWAPQARRSHPACAAGLGDGYDPGQDPAEVPRGGLPALARAFLDRGRSILPIARRGQLDGRAAACAAGECVPPPRFWQARLDRLAARVRVSRPVTLLESCLAEVPVVIGYVRPVILMPVGLLAGLPAGQVESILLHELAHIRRHDYLVNLMQIVVEGLVFYHPAVWWISGVIRAERENCCDDLVVATQGDALRLRRCPDCIGTKPWGGARSRAGRHRR